MKNIFKYKEKFQSFFVVLFFVFGFLPNNIRGEIPPVSALTPNESIIGGLGRLLEDQQRRELYDREYRERPPGWDKWDDDWRRDRGEHRGWDRGKHKGWSKHHEHHRHKHRHHHKHHKHYHHPYHHKHKGHNHKGHDRHGRERGGHKGSGKWGK